MTGFGPSLAALASAWLAFTPAACGGDDDGALAPTVDTSAASDTLMLANGASGHILGNDRLNGAAATACNSGDVLANDTLGGAPATSANVAVTATGPLPVGITLSADRPLQLAGGAAGGSVDIGDLICRALVPSNCAMASAALTVPIPARSAVARSPFAREHSASRPIFPAPSASAAWRGPTG